MRGVPCGVATIVLKDFEKDGRTFRRVLLGRRKGALGGGQWCFPGGALEPGETPAAGAIRELYEETGLKVELKDLMVWWACPHTNTFGDNTITGKESWVTLYFWVVLSPDAPEVKLKEPDKCYEWRWFPLTRMPEPLYPATRVCANESGWHPDAKRSPA